jgi:hypothetical protein
MTTAFTLGKLASVPLADAELEQILWRNAFLAFPRLALPAAAAA